MKRISKILAILLFLSISFSCTEEFFDKRPMGSMDETVFYNEKGIDALLIGAYGLVDGGGTWTIDWGASIQNWTYGSVASDDAYKGSEKTDQIPINQIERWEVATDNWYPEQKWKWGIGIGAFRCNEVLRILKLAEGVSAEKAKEFEAEARFLRGLYYFETWLVFGDRIPLITEETEDPKLVKNENAAGKVLEFIINDLKFAWENLPASQSQPGRPTKYAAMALGARAYLQELKYTEAKTLLDNIINSGKYSLMPNYIDNYLIAKNNNAESIFEIQANVNDGACCSGNAEMGIGLNWPHGSDIGMCCGFHQPSQNLVNAFKVDANGLPLFDTFNNTDLANDQGIPSEAEFNVATDPVDPRLDWTVSRRGIPYRDWGINRGRDWERFQPFGGPYLPASKPFFLKSERNTLSTTTGWMTGNNANNYRYMRYTHVLLWRAEVAAFEGDLVKARDLVNQVRTRAGKQVVMGKVLINKLPPAVYPWGPNSTDADYKTGGAVDWTQPAANYKIGTYASFADKKQAMRAVQWELRLEFATEGMRFFDLRRWDNLPADVKGTPMATILNSFAVADQRIRDVMKDATFDERDKYQPIPQTQIDLQPGIITQRSGY